MKTNRALIFLAALGGLFVSSCEYEPEATLDKLEFTLLKDGKGYSVAASSMEIVGDVVIPATYEGLPVTSIKPHGFSRLMITSVYIPKGVTVVEEDAFSYCENLESLVIPDTVSSIHRNAFYKCSALTSFTIGPNVNAIGQDAFFGCSSLESVEIQNGISVLSNYAFEQCESLKSITLPDSVTEIGSGCFQDCTSLKSVTLGKGIKTIKTYAFSECLALSSLTYGDTVESWDKVIRQGAWLRGTKVKKVICEDGEGSTDVYELPIIY